MEDLRVYGLKKGDDGIYLTVEKCEKTPFPTKVVDLYNELKQRKIDYDASVLNKIFNEASNIPEKIAPLDGKQIYGPILDLKILPDKLKAILIVYPSLQNMPIEQGVLEHFLWKKGVKYGIKKEIFPEVLKWHPHYCEWVIAEGKPSIDGNDASLKYYFQKETHEFKPKILEDGRVDFYDLDLIQIVEEGETLVERIPPTEGVNGINVFGEEIKAKPGNDVHLPIGANTRINEEKTKLFSTIKGHLSFVNNKVNVFPTYEVNGDVDFATGNINFPGNVIIKGNVKNSFLVKAGGDVDIYGNLAGTVIAGGNLNIRKGIIQGKAEVEGDIYVRYIENGIAVSKGNIFVGEAIMHSNVSCEKKLSVSGKRGLIVGGRVCAKEEITAKNIGSPMGTQTHLEVGLVSDIIDEYHAVCTRIKYLEKEYEKNRENLNTFQRLHEEGKLTENKQQLYLKLWELQCKMQKEMEVLKAKKETFDLQFAEIGDVSIKVWETVHSGVVIHIGSYVYPIMEEQYRVKFRIDDFGIRGFNL